MKILVFGDSIAWGAFDKERGGWVERLKTHYLNNFSDKGLGVYNLSVSSNDTRGVVKTLRADMDKIDSIEHEEYILLFSIGTNDARYIRNSDNPFMSKEEFGANLQGILDIAKKYLSSVIFTDLPRVDEKLTLPWHHDDYWENRDIQEFEEIVKSFCQTNNLHCIPIADAVGQKDLSDGLHPNSKGHQKIFEAVKDYLEKNKLV